MFEFYRSHFNGFVIAIAFSMTMSHTSHASLVSNGSLGIDAAGLKLPNGSPLTGTGIRIGQVEAVRAACPLQATSCSVIDSASKSNIHVRPTNSFLKDGFQATPDLDLVEDLTPPIDPFQHGTAVASVLISVDASDDGPTNGDAPRGVAPQASLYSTAVGFSDTVPYVEANHILAMQHLARKFETSPPIGDVRIINHSYGLSSPPTGPFDGNSQVTLAVDWLAKRYNVLQVVGGTQSQFPGRAYPADNFNGITVGASTTPNQMFGGGTFRRVAAFNSFTEDAAGTRVSISLIAPGEHFDIGIQGSAETATPFGTSFAAPHVAGTAALLQQYAQFHVSAATPRWTGTVGTGIGAHPRAYRHELMKAVLMNSADKLIDNGTVAVPGTTFGSTITVPRGGLLGMDRTVVRQDGNSTFVDSEAYTDTLAALDIQMGAGHLNAHRAIQQFRSGEYDAGSSVPMIGWDYGTSGGVGIGGVRKYVFNQPLLRDSFVSATIAFDRVVNFAVDSGTPNFYDHGDSFAPYVSMNDPNPYGDDVISDLDIYLMPKGATSFSQVISRFITDFEVDAISESDDSTVDHLFFQIPATAEYELWVRQWDDDVGNQDYALAWWAVSAAGDFNGDGNWNCTDLNNLSTAIATQSTNSIFDMNRDGALSLADITDKASGWLVAGGAINTVASPGGATVTSGYPFVPGDANLDDFVDGSDFGIWNANKFTLNSQYCSGDFNANGAIDSSDFGIWNANKNTSSLTATLPEPCAMLKILSFVLCLFLRRRLAPRALQK